MRMASLRVRWVGNGGYLTSSSSVNSEEQSRCVCFRRLVPGHRKTGRSHRLSVAATTRSDDRLSGTAGPAGLDMLVRSNRAGGDWKQFGGDVRRKEKVMDMEEDRSKKLDQWMRESVVEIVNNIEEAPFLVHIYPDDERKGSSSSGTAVELVVEKAVAEDWPAIRGRWESGSPTPNGVILVEELNDSASCAKEEGKSRDMNSTQLNPATKVWGLLIQAKGLNCTACYILKTSRVKGFLGSCTHFCLLRVECFVENAETQLKKLWLQR
ncbi:hypothetical protein NMG60_11008004 [Bertholletia excelsa]